jgi:hypothetical protein
LVISAFQTKNGAEVNSFDGCLNSAESVAKSLTFTSLMTLFLQESREKSSRIKDAR